MRLPSYNKVKRVVDIGLTVASLPIVLPTATVVAVLVRTTLGRPVIFKQERPGLGGEPFNIVKFRTMRTIDHSRGIVTNEQRMTALGKVIRSLSVDELPSLINVLRGQMSLIGPRPLRMSYLNRYSRDQRRRQTVRPGLTGLAQVSGRNALSWDDRLDLDLDYIDNIGPELDLRILLKTFLKVFRREGVAAEGQATMSEFFGPNRTTDLALRPLAREDLLTRVYWLRSPAVREGVDISFWPEVDATEAWFESTLTNNCRQDFTAVGRTSGAPEAMCGLTDIEDDSAKLYIFVNPARLGLGYGSQTMEMLLAKARQRGLRELHLETNVANYRARAMYERLGFEVNETGNNPKKIFMTVQLG